jgi:hypothetical protein
VLSLIVCVAHREARIEALTGVARRPIIKLC